MLELRDVAVRLGRREVLRGVSLDLRAGEVVALLGPNGSGKTTLLRTAMGFVRATSGDVRWPADDRVLASPERLARLAAYLPQHPTASPWSRVREAIALGRFALGGAAGEAIDDAARRTNVVDLLDRRVGELSGGQRQRVFLARALAQETPALLLDEPASFLDLRHQLDALRLLREASRERGTAVLMTSHDLNLAAEFADRVAILYEGRLAAVGPPGDALTERRVGEVFGVDVRRADVDGRPRLIAIS